MDDTREKFSGRGKSLESSVLTFSFLRAQELGLSALSLFSLCGRQRWAENSMKETNV